jgi:SOS-response transcriptional repressor LexA
MEPKPTNTDAIFQAIITHKQTNDGNSPTIRQLMDATGITSTSVVAYHLRKLETSGLISRNPFDSRAINVPGGKWVYEGQGLA